MRIAAVTQHGVADRETFELDALTPGLNAVCGPSRTGRLRLAGLLAHALFGKSAAPGDDAAPWAALPGEVVVESDLGRYRVRRYQDTDGACRLTLAALDGSPVDAGTMRALVGGLSPSVLAPLCAVSFRPTPDARSLLSVEFARGYQSIEGAKPFRGGRRTAELAARRDALAHELETRIAGERRASKDLETRCRELDRWIQDEQQTRTTLEQRLQSIENALAETDARLRYRRLELNLDRQIVDGDIQGSLNEDDEAHAARLRTMLAELAQQEAKLRARLAEVQASIADGGGLAVAESQAWLKVARQLSHDLAGEVARLARATASQQCVCRDAHPRLRPISETIQRQLDVLADLVDEHRRSLLAVELQAEVDQLSRSQAELRAHLGQLLERRRIVAPATKRHRAAGDAQGGESAPAGRSPSSFTAADAGQLESRLAELEQDRFRIVEQLRARERKLREFAAERETAARQRAALLSARSIEYVQQELSRVQEKLEHSAAAYGDEDLPTIAEENPARASDYLAQLTDGRLVSLVLVDEGRRACVVDRSGATLRVETLTAAERGQVYLSFALSLLSAARRAGVALPLVLEEPFEHLDSRGVAALAAVLDDFCRQGHQVLVFTASPAGADRLASVGAAMHELGATAPRSTTPPPNPQPAEASAAPSGGPSARTKRKPKAARDADKRRRKEKAERAKEGGDDSRTDRSDAA